MGEYSADNDEQNEEDDDGGEEKEDDDVDDDENDDYQWLRDEESALGASTIQQWTISAPDRLVVLSKRLGGCIHC